MRLTGTDTQKGAVLAELTIPDDVGVQMFLRHFRGNTASAAASMADTAMDYALAGIAFEDENGHRYTWGELSKLAADYLDDVQERGGLK